MDGGGVPGIDPNKPSIARTYDALLGGKDNFAVDRALAERFITDMPGARTIALDNRAVLVRAIREIVLTTPVRQFLDLGSGLPTADNVHQVAQRHAPDARVVYVDSDPVVLAHGRALLEENDETTVVQADLRDPEAIWEQTRDFLDFEKPVAVILSAILHHINDDEDPAGLVRYWRERVPAGSYFFVSHFRSENDPRSAEMEAVLQASLGRGRWRTTTEIEALLDGLQILPPGIVPCAEWKPVQAEGVSSLFAATPELTVWERLIVAVLAVKP
jgi:hypothetical protein